MIITNNKICWIKDNNKEGSSNRWKYVINNHYMKEGFIVMNGGFQTDYYARLRKMMRNTVLITHNKYDNCVSSILIHLVINSNTPHVKLLGNNLKGEHICQSQD